VIFQKYGDLIKAEELARESLRIRSLIYGSNDQIVGSSCNLLANVLRTQGKFCGRNEENVRALYSYFYSK
jgi:hypothetical protein